MLVDKFAASNAEGPIEDYAARCGCAACRGSDSALEAPLISYAAAADEPDGTIAVGGSASGEIGTAGDVDSYSFGVVAGETYTVSLRGTGATPVPDTFLTLFNNVGVEADTNDDGGTGTNSLLTFTATTTGTWEIEAEGYPGDGHTGGYTVDLFQHGADSVAGDTTTTEALPFGGTTFGAIESGGDLDVYSVSLTAGSLYLFEVAGGADYESNAPAVPPGQLDTIISILDAEGNVVATNDDILFPSDPSSAVSFVAEEGGAYFVQVEAYDGQTGGYALEAQEHAITGSPLETIDWGTKVGTNAITVYFAETGEIFDGVASLGWTDYEKGRAMAAFKEYADIANLGFSVVDDPALATFKLVTDTSADYLGYFNPPGETNEGVGVFSTAGKGWDRTGATGGLEKGGYGFITLIHEIGHGLGLAHPHDEGGTSTVMPGVSGPFGSYGPRDLNQGIYTTMSYNDGWVRHPDGLPESDAFGWQSGPMALDIAVIQQKYGAAARNSGNTTYILPSANAAGTYWSSIWDTGGNDTIAHKGSAAATIDLTRATLKYSPSGGGAISYVAGVFGGFTIANKVLIENASGGGGADLLIGNFTSNKLDGNGGADRMEGGLGDDRYTVNDALDVVVEAANAGVDRILASVSYVLALDSHVEVLSANSGSYTDPINLTGSAYHNLLIGNDGRNVLDGRGGADSLRGWGGNDVYRVDDIDDKVHEVANGGLDRVIAHTSFSLGESVQVELLSTNDPSATTAIHLTGSDTRNIITGNAGTNVLNGGEGADTLKGLGGNDRFHVDHGADRVVEAAGGGTDRAFATASYALQTGVHVETLSTASDVGTGAINLTGNELGNQIIGNAGANVLRGLGAADTLRGLDGADRLVGGAGNDDLFGGAGADRFYFDAPLSASENVDEILDFATGDMIFLDRSVFTGIAKSGILADSAFSTGTAAQDESDRIIYEQDSGRIFYDADGLGGTAAVLFAKLDPATTLTSADFVAVT